MRGIWRVRKALDWLERTTGSEPDPEPVVALIEPPPKPAAAALPQGLWMPKFQPWAYVVVPKSACTTAGQYLFYVDHGYYYHDDIHRLRYGLHKAGLNPQMVRTHLDEANEDLFTFSFVRDPYARLVSGFLDKVLDLEQGYRQDIRDRLTSDWQVQLAGDRSQVDNFRSFIRFVEYQYERWEEFQLLDPDQPDPRAPWETVDINWLRQSWYLRRGRRHAGTVDFIGAVETMTDDLESLTAHLRPPHVPPLDAMPKFGAGPKREAPLEDFYDDETKAIVDRHFGPDFRLFGYPKVVGGEPKKLTGFERADLYNTSLPVRTDDPEDCYNEIATAATSAVDGDEGVQT